MIADFSYTPFLKPMPVWDYWYLLLLPLCAAVAIVYKSIKCHSMRQVAREATELLFWILLGFSAAAAGLAILVRAFEH